MTQPAHARLFRPGTAPSSGQVLAQEFVGPFANWLCARSSASGTCGAAAAGYYNAAGDGVTDDTAALQNGLNGLSASHPVLWLPCGTYKISATLQLAASTAINDFGMIGANPACTEILWGGAAGRANFLGNITGNVLTARTPGNGALAIGQSLSGVGIPPGTEITGQTSGTAGQGGNYTLSWTAPSPIGSPSNQVAMFTGAMLWLDDVSYGAFDRITWNAASSAGFVLWVDPFHFGSGTEFSDSTFENAQESGFLCGYPAQYSCSEIAVLRDNFISDGQEGMGTCDYNSLDVWVWYTTFRSNRWGIDNTCSPTGGAGNFRVSNSVFLNDTGFDVVIGSGGLFSIENSYTSGGIGFLNQIIGASFSNITVTGNTIANVSPAAGYFPVEVNSQGPLIYAGNSMVSPTTSPPWVVSGAAGGGVGALLSYGNSFTAGSIGCSSSSNTFGRGTNRCHEAGDQIVASINTTQPQLPGPLPNNNRTVTEVSLGSGNCGGASCAAVIQADLNAIATAGCNTNALHLQAGNYTIGASITVPANCRVWIGGDGLLSTHLSGAGFTGPVFACGGSSGSNNVCQATFANFYCTAGAHVRDCIDITNADQPGARVYGDELLVGGTPPGDALTGWWSDSLDYTLVELHDLQADAASATGDVGLLVTGGASAAAGNWLGGATNVFDGANSGDWEDFQLRNCGHLLVRDVWHDGGAGNGNAVVDAASNGTAGCGAVTYSGAEMNFQDQGVPYQSLGQVSGGSLAATTYFVVFTYTNASGETNVSPEQQLAVAADNLLTVSLTAPIGGTGNATGWNVYAGTASGSETLQNSTPISLSSTWTEPTTGLVNGAAPTGFNCSSGCVSTQTALFFSQALLNNWQGTAAFLNDEPNEGVVVSGTGSGANNLFDGIVNSHVVSSAAVVSDTTSPADNYWWLNPIVCTPPCSGAIGQLSAELPSDPGTPSSTFLATTLNQLLTSLPTPILYQKPAGVTDVQLYRLQINEAGVGVHVSH
jgi:hypothetical protein